MVELAHHAKKGSDGRRLIKEEVWLRLPEIIRKCHVVQVRVELLEDSFALTFRHLLAILALQIDLGEYFVRVHLKLPRLVQFEHCDLKLHLRFASESVTPFL